VLKLLIMLEISLITVIYKRIGKFWYITQSELNNKGRYNQVLEVTKDSITECLK
jgi:hypothetical protein